jgi:dienelactone hydrolase
MKKFTYAILLPLILVVLTACGSKSASGSTSTPDAVLIAAGEKVVDDLAAGNLDPVYTNFDASMVKALSKDQLGQFWPQLETQMGKYQGRDGATMAPYQNYQIVSVKTNFAKDSIIFNVVFSKDGKIAGMNLKPTTTPTPSAYKVPGYVDQSKFSEQEVTVGSGKWALPGTLTLPKGDGPFPAVVLVHGSGPNDRDESIGPNRPFKDIAWGLASKGIAVLRYDKRTKAHADLYTPDELDKITLGTETIDDSILAADLLAKNPKIDPKQIYVLGHSQGGMAAPRIGQQDPNLAGLIILAGPARPLEEVIVDQLTYIAGVDGTVSEAEKNSIDMAKTAAVKVKDPNLSVNTPSSELSLGIPVSWWQDVRGYQPAEVAKNLTMPILLLQGGRDYQVTKADFDIWKQALTEKVNAKLLFFPDMNHLFISGKGMATPEEYSKPGTVAAEVIDQISSWLLNPAK